MNRRPFGLAAALALAVFAAACDEAPPTAPASDGPSFGHKQSAPTAPTSPNACVFTGNPSLSNASSAYFTVSSERRTASDLIAAMQAGFTASSYSGARDKGFD
jgi:hypothetical protein